MYDRGRHSSVRDTPDLRNGYPEHLYLPLHQLTSTATAGAAAAAAWPSGGTHAGGPREHEVLTWVAGGHEVLTWVDGLSGP